MLDLFFKFLAWLHGNGKDVEEVCCEWHSFWNGFSEVVCLRIPPIVSINERMLEEMSNEWHYYAWGRAGGAMFWIAVVLCLI